MQVAFRRSFLRDLERIGDPHVRDRVRSTITQVEQAHDLAAVSDLRKLRSAERYYRIRVGAYRLGLIIDDDTVWFVRCLHRRDIYRYFP